MLAAEGLLATSTRKGQKVYQGYEVSDEDRRENQAWKMEHHNLRSASRLWPSEPTAQLKSRTKLLAQR